MGMVVVGKPASLSPDRDRHAAPIASQDSPQSLMIYEVSSSHCLVGEESFSFSITGCFPQTAFPLPGHSSRSPGLRPVCR